MLSIRISLETDRHTRAMELCFTASTVFDIGTWDASPEFSGWYITFAGVHLQYYRQMAGVVLSPAKEPQ